MGWVSHLSDKVWMEALRGIVPFEAAHLQTCYDLVATI